MPNIKTINAPQLGVQSTDRGVEAYTQAARREGAFFNQAAEDQRREGAELGGAISDAGRTAVDFLDHQQISAGMAKFSSLHLQLTKAWDDTLKGADPNDPSVGQKFREGVVEPALEKFTEGFYTEKAQNWAEERMGSLREHFNTKTVADQSTLAMVAAKENIRTMANTYSTSVAIDPSSTATVLKQFDSDMKSFVDSSPTLTAEHRAQIQDELGERIKEGIVRAGVTSAINKNPDAGLKMAQDPAYAPYLNGAEVNAFYTQAKRNEKLDADMARTRQRQELEDKSTGNLNNVIKNLYDPEQKQKITAQEIAQLPADQMRPSDREHAIKLIDAELKPQAESKASAVEADRALAGIRTGHTSMDDILKLKEDGKITRSDFTFLQTQYRDYQDSDGNALPKVRASFIQNFKSTIDQSNDFTGRTDETGKRNLWAFEQELVRREETMRAAGKDPHSLYDPKSTEYMGSVQALAPYKKTMQDDMETYNQQLEQRAAKKPDGAPNDAQQAPDGNWYVKRGDKFFKVK